MPIGTSDGLTFDDPVDHELHVSGVMPQFSTGDEPLPKEKERYQTWPEKMARTLIDAFKLPGDVYQGKEAPDSEQTIGRAAELAGAMVLGPAPVASKIVDGTLGSIAGISANTANRSNLKFAQEMANEGKDVESIWKSTGWFQGTDKRWRFEIPDQAAKLTSRAEQHISEISQDATTEAAKQTNSGLAIRTSLNKVLDFPELYKAYPELKDVNFEWNPAIKDFGQWYESKNKIVINPELIDKFKEDKVGVILHEIQHAIQDKEKFNYGINDKEGFLHTMAEAINQLPEASPEKYNMIIDYLKALHLPEENIRQALYKRLPGEQESSVVELRHKQSAGYNALNSPATTQKYMRDAQYLPPEFNP